jgi:hypothetical protein
MAFYSLSENPSIYDIDGDGYGGSRNGYNSLRGIGARSSSSSRSSGSSSGSSDSEDDGSSSDSSVSEDVPSKIPPRSIMGQSLRMASVAHPAPEGDFGGDEYLPNRPKRSREDMEKTQPNSVAQSPRSPSVLSMHLSSASQRRDSSFRMDISTSGSATTTGASPTPNGYASPQAPQPAATPMIPS